MLQSMPPKAAIYRRRWGQALLWLNWPYSALGSVPSLGAAPKAESRLLASSKDTPEKLTFFFGRGAMGGGAIGSGSDGSGAMISTAPTSGCASAACLSIWEEGMLINRWRSAPIRSTRATRLSATNGRRSCSSEICGDDSERHRSITSCVQFSEVLAMVTLVLGPVGTVLANTGPEMARLLGAR